MTRRAHNFSAGPAVLPVPVLEEIQRDLLCLPGAWGDMDDYLAAIDDGRRLRIALDAVPAEIDLTGAHVLETLPNNDGVQFLNTTGELRRYIAVTDSRLTVDDLDELYLDELHRPLESYDGVVIALEGDRLVIVGSDG